MFRVFPATLINGQKVPLIRGWAEAASSDPAQHKLWQDQFRDRLHFWGIPAGAVNGFIALDVDVKGVNGFESLKSLGYVVPPTLEQTTPSGGKHFLFRFDPANPLKNSVSSKLGLDVRTSGGWIAFYSFSNNLQLAEPPEWLSKLSVQKEPSSQNSTSIKLAPEIARTIFEECISNIKNAPPGESNNVLNTESYKVGQLVVAGSVSREFAESELFRAAKDRGKPDYESRATISSGLDGGTKNPILSPFTGTVSAPINFTVPSSPEPAQRWTPNYLTRADLLNTSKLRKPQLFKDWSSEDISITTADGGTGKTTLKLYEAICLALGENFLGFQCMQRGKTLFITGEDTDKKLGAMLGAILQQMGLLDGSPINEAKVETVLNSVVIKKDADLCLIAKDKQNFLFPNLHALEKILQAVDDIKPKMIVFDPISSFWGSEAALNDMNKAVTRFMSELVDRSGACVEMINHMGKSSSATKDMTQFAGRGGSGLPSNSRVSRVLRSLPAEEYQEMTGLELVGENSAMLCNVNKFSDGSPLFNKPFIITRSGYLFGRIFLSPAKVKEMEKKMDDKERVFTFIKTARSAGRWPTVQVCVANFMNQGDPMSADRIKRAIALLGFEGYMGEKVIEVENPDLTQRNKALIIVDMEGKENG